MDDRRLLFAQVTTTDGRTGIYYHDLAASNYSVRGELPFTLLYRPREPCSTLDLVDLDVKTGRITALANVGAPMNKLVSFRLDSGSGEGVDADRWDVLIEEDGNRLLTGARILASGRLLLVAYLEDAKVGVVSRRSCLH